MSLSIVFYGLAACVDEWAFVRKAVKKTDELEDNRAEFSTVDYTPCTNIRSVTVLVLRDALVDADDMSADALALMPCRPVDLTLKLRPTKAGRTIRLAAVVTGYNEDGDELRRTLTGIAANLSTAHKVGLHWSEVVVIILIDGRDRISPSMVDYASKELQVRQMWGTFFSICVRSFHSLPCSSSPYRCLTCRCSRWSTWANS